MEEYRQRGIGVHGESRKEHEQQSVSLHAVAYSSIRQTLQWLYTPKYTPNIHVLQVLHHPGPMRTPKH